MTRRAGAHRAASRGPWGDPTRMMGPSFPAGHPLEDGAGDGAATLVPKCHKDLSSAWFGDELHKVSQELGNGALGAKESCDKVSQDSRRSGHPPRHPGSV